jgi:hypothetical protein
MKKKKKEKKKKKKGVLMRVNEDLKGGIGKRGKDKKFDEKLFSSAS